MWQSLGCDLMTVSGHKLGGPAGIGALYVRDPAELAPAMLGGPQENALRAGTPNLLGAIGLGAAAEVIAHDRHGEAAPSRRSPIGCSRSFAPRFLACASTARSRRGSATRST